MSDVERLEAAITLLDALNAQLAPAGEVFDDQRRILLAQLAVLQAAVWEIQRETFRYSGVNMEHTAILGLADAILGGDHV